MKRRWAAVDLRPQRSLESRLCCWRVSTPQRQRLAPQGLLTSNSSNWSQPWSTPHPRPPPHLHLPLLPGLWSMQVLQHLPHTEYRLEAATNTTCLWNLSWTTLTVRPPSFYLGVFFFFSFSSSRSLAVRWWAFLCLQICRCWRRPENVAGPGVTWEDQGGVWPVHINRTPLFVQKNQPNTLRVKLHQNPTDHPKGYRSIGCTYTHTHTHFYRNSCAGVDARDWNTFRVKACRNESALQAGKSLHTHFEGFCYNSLCCFTYISPDTVVKIHERRPGRFIITSNFLCKDIFIPFVISYIRNHLLTRTLYSVATMLLTWKAWDCLKARFISYYAFEECLCRFPLAGLSFTLLCTVIYTYYKET